MRKSFFQAAVVAGMLAVAGAASAQTYAPSGASGFGGYGHGGHGYGGYHSSTYEEGVFRGLADFTRSIGEADYMSSLAGINRQETLSRFLDNRQKGVETYFQIKQINRAAREAARSQPLSPEQYAKLARQQSPNRLHEGEYDRVVGRLNWPAVLAGDDFAGERAALDKTFAGRTAHDVGVSTAFHGQVRSLTDSMQVKLQSQIGAMSPMEFIAAKKFLSGLAFESQQPLVVAGLASR